MSAPDPAPDPRPFDAGLRFVPCAPMSLEDLDHVPVRFRFSRVLPVSPSELFGIFEDPTSWPRWAQGIGHVAWTSPRPFGVGTTRTVTFWGGMKVYEDFMVWEAPRQMAFHFYGTSEEVWTRFGEHYLVDDLGGGRCRLTWRVCYQPAGRLARVHPLVGPLMGLNLRSYLWRLERYARRTHPRSPR